MAVVRQDIVQIEFQVKNANILSEMAQQANNLRDTLAGVGKNGGMADMAKGMKINKSLIDMGKGFTVKRVCMMAGGLFTKEQILEINAKLNKIKKKQK